MAKLVKAGETTAAKKRMYFLCVDATDGISPEAGEAGGQPQISTNGGDFTNTGIGVLSAALAATTGWYYAELTDGAVDTAGRLIEGRYKSANVAETPCRDAIQVVACDPDAASNLGLTNLDAVVSTGCGLSTAGKAALVTALLQGDCTAYEATGATGVRVADLLTAIRAVLVGRMTVSGTTASYYEVDGTTVLLRHQNIAADYSSHDTPTGPA